jgi:hypothetical protein
MTRMAVMTKSFAPDFELCAALSRSVLDNSPETVYGVFVDEVSDAPANSFASNDPLCLSIGSTGRRRRDKSPAPPAAACDSWRRRRGDEQAAAIARILPSQVVVDVMRVHDEGRALLAGRILAQIAVTKERELQLAMSNRLARRTRSRARCIAGTVTCSRSKLRVEASDRSCSSRLARPCRT